MPALANQKHEIFAQELAKGRTCDEAYALGRLSPFALESHLVGLFNGSGLGRWRWYVAEEFGTFVGHAFDEDERNRATVDAVITSFAKVQVGPLLL